MRDLSFVFCQLVPYFELRESMLTGVFTLTLKYSKGNEEKQDSSVMKTKRKEDMPVKRVVANECIESFLKGIEGNGEEENENENGLLPAPILSLQERQALKCLAAFFTLSPFAFKNRSTQASLQNFSC